MKVSEALMPAPRLIIPAHGKAEGLHHLYMEHIKAVASPVHLDEKTAASIPMRSMPSSISTRKPFSSNYPTLMMESSRPGCSTPW